MSSPPFASSGTTEEEWPVHHRRAESNKKEKAQTKQSEKNEKKMPIRKQKKSARCGILTYTLSVCFIYLVNFIEAMNDFIY